MPLLVCPDCKKEISDAAPACPNCGRPASAPKPAKKQKLPQFKMTKLMNQATPRPMAATATPAGNPNRKGITGCLNMLGVVLGFAVMFVGFTLFGLSVLGIGTILFGLLIVVLCFF